MGQDIHAFLEHNEDGIWTCLARLYFPRYRGLFTVLKGEARGFIFNYNASMHIRNCSMEVGIAWRSDQRNIGIHHEGILDYQQFRSIRAAFPDEDAEAMPELGSAIDFASKFNARFIYWFDN